MMLYSGAGNLSAVTLFIYGDGVSNTVSIDLTQPPFDFNFTNNPPSAAVVTNAPSDPVGDVDINGNILTITFDSPPPFFDPENPTPSGRQLTVQLLYG